MGRCIEHMEMDKYHIRHDQKTKTRSLPC
jgi:hypothetical protein